MNYWHQEYAESGRWNRFDFINQMANIGSEVFRTINWRKKDKKLGQDAFFRSLELVDFTIQDKKNRSRLKELLYLRELWTDFNFANSYDSTPEFFEKYFYAFNYAARINL